LRRVRVEIEGIVQGVGFRPFLYRLAREYRLAGWVRNTPAGVLLEVEGEAEAVARFLPEIERQAPALAAISGVQLAAAAPEGETEFRIVASSAGGSGIQISPDCDVCPACLSELFDPADRRYRYPFINCTNCGPRYSIITGIPYDRPFTTMAPFRLCAACRAEYEDPANRRFHAQPVGCPDCGPVLRLLDAAGEELAGDPLEEAVRRLRAGQIVAVKGVGGYHLAVDAGNDAAVQRLRERKKRDEKPFALMAADLAGIARFACADAAEAKLLVGTERPIVLLQKRAGHPISPHVAPANGYFGVMLPSTPLHHLLLTENFPALVMTSGNISDEPIAYQDDEALARLAHIADFFLAHDRAIHVRSDDSVLRVCNASPLFLRRARGYVPRSVLLPFKQRRVLATGGELKAAICLTRDDRAFLSQHIGDLKNAATALSLAATAEHLQRILQIAPEVVAHDLHPDYLSTSYAQSLSNLPRVAVQHHHAHMASCMAENGLDGEVLGVVFDGSGYGTDGCIWGGEFLHGGYRGFERLGHMPYIPLPGGDAAVREPYRMAIAHLFPLFGESLFDLPLPCIGQVPWSERKLFLQMLRRGINSPLTSSCGRLFDAVAALLGVRQRVTYEGQAAIELEALAAESSSTRTYPFSFLEKGTAPDFAPTLRAVVEEVLAGRERRDIARAFHHTVAAATAAVCAAIRVKTGTGRVVLSGGVFQNRLLSEGLSHHLVQVGFAVFTHRLVPPNDGGLALGQAVVAGQSTT
jgi:hydrogenase maturation protein HypF